MLVPTRYLCKSSKFSNQGKRPLLGPFCSLCWCKRILLGCEGASLVRVCLQTVLALVSRNIGQLLNHLKLKMVCSCWRGVSFFAEVKKRLRGEYKLEKPFKALGMEKRSSVLAWVAVRISEARARRKGLIGTLS